MSEIKGLQCGNFFVVEPMKYGAQGKEERVNEMMTDKNYILQEKKDGAFFQLMKNENGEIALFSRTVSKKTGEYVNRIDSVPHIQEWAKTNLPKSTTLLGEIYVVGGKSKDVTKIMGALTDKALERQFKSAAFGGPVHFYVFDCIKYNGQDLCDKPAEYRIGHVLHYEMLEAFEWSNGITNEHGQVCEYVELATTYSLDKDDDFENCADFIGEEWVYHDSFQQKLNEIFAAGGEGAVIKSKDGTYQPGKRPTYNMKVKTVKDNIDMVVMECLDPEREYSGKEIDTWPYWVTLQKTHFGEVIYEKYNKNNGDKVANVKGIDFRTIPVTKAYFYGWKNAIRVGAYDDDGNLVPVGRVASGLTDEDRAAMGRDPQSFIGRSVEIQAMSVDKDEQTLRHGFVVCWRDDKPAEDCLLKEIFN